MSNCPKYIPKVYQKYTKHISKYIKIYPRYTKIYQDIPNIFKYIQDIPRRPGPDRGPRLGARPGRAAPPPLGISYICCMYFGIFCMYIKYNKMVIVMAASIVMAYPTYLYRTVPSVALSIPPTSFTIHSRTAMWKHTQAQLLINKPPFLGRGKPKANAVAWCRNQIWSNS